MEIDIEKERLHKVYKTHKANEKYLLFKHNKLNHKPKPIRLKPIKLAHHIISLEISQELIIDKSTYYQSTPLNIFTPSIGYISQIPSKIRFCNICYIYSCRIHSFKTLINKG